MNETIQRLEGVGVDIKVNQDRLTVKDGDANADVYVSKPTNPPLSDVERHVGLLVNTTHGSVEIELCAEGLDALIDALYQTQQREDTA